MPDSPRPDLLYLVHRFPFPPDKGDRILTFHLLKFLARYTKVHLACLADEPVKEDELAAVRQYCEQLTVAPLGWTRWLHGLGSWLRGGTVTEGAFRSSALAATLRSWAKQTRFHAALATSSSMVPYLRLPELREIPAVVDLIDVDSQKWFDYAEAGRGIRAWFYRTEGRRLRRLEKPLPAWARAVVLVSQAEVDLYRSFCDPGKVEAVTCGVDLEYFHPNSPVEESACVFVGALDYPPNVDGVCWFCRHIWPEVRRQRPGAMFYLVGRRPASAVQRLAESPGVEVVGQVPDVRPHLAKAAVSVVPLRIARGIQNKVLESLAMGKAMVASPQSLAALGVQPGVHLLAPSSPEEWVESVVHLLDDADQRQRLGQAGRKYVEEHHQWDRCLEPMVPLLGLTR